MSLYALEDLDDAPDATGAFLWPIDRSTWIELAVVVFFVGGPGADLDACRYNAPADQGPPPGEFPMSPDVGSNSWLVIAVVVAAALLIGSWSCSSGRSWSSSSSGRSTGRR
jgi:hypothetical protein